MTIIASLLSSFSLLVPPLSCLHVSSQSSPCPGRQHHRCLPLTDEGTQVQQEAGRDALCFLPEASPLKGRAAGQGWKACKEVEISETNTGGLGKKRAARGQIKEMNSRMLRASLRLESRNLW